MPSNGFDSIALERTLQSMLQRLDTCEAALGITPDSAESLPNDTNAVTGRVYTIAQPAPSTAVGTNGTYSLQDAITVPGGVLRAGSVIDVTLAVQLKPQTFPWSFQFNLVDGANTHRVCDVQAIAATPTPTAAGMLAHARFSGTVRDNGANLYLEADSFVAWHFPGGTTNQTSGIASSSLFTGLPTFDRNADLVLEPTLVVTGATVGDTAQLLAMAVRVLDPTPQLF